MSTRLSISVFSDVICPWCFLGKRRLERALDQLGVRRSAGIRWLPFELNPDMPPEGMERAAYRARKFGEERAAALDREMATRGLAEGIHFDFGGMRRTPNTRRAHLFIAHASRQGRGEAAAEALFHAYFEEGRDIGDDAVLGDMAGEMGLDEAAMRAALDDSALLRSVIELEEEARRLGVAGVPFFIVDEAWAVSGAQETETWVEILRKMPLTAPEAHAGSELM
jgi:predicted DsbA family dithiol-disulfide isomerase